jgi:hypothetical protein
MFQRKIIVDDTYRKEMSKRLTWNEDNVKEAMINKTKYEANLVDDIRKLKTEMIKACIERDKVWKDKWNYYSYESEVVMETDAEKKQAINTDPEYAEIKQMCDEIENDIEFCKNLKDVFKNMGWDMKNWVEYTKFLAGVD